MSRLKKEAPKEAEQASESSGPQAPPVPADNNNETSAPQNTMERDEIEAINRACAKKRGERDSFVWYLFGLASQATLALLLACFLSLRTQVVQQAINLSILVSLVVDIVVKLAYLTRLSR